MSKKTALFPLILFALILGACVSVPPPTPTTSTEESAGDAREEAVVIETEINNLNESTDFPDINETDFGTTP
jgi:hypothetical protein